MEEEKALLVGRKPNMLLNDNTKTMENDKFFIALLDGSTATIYYYCAAR